MQDGNVNNPAQSVEYVIETDVAFSEVCVVHVDLPDVIHVIPLVHDGGYRFFTILLDLYDVIFTTDADSTPVCRCMSCIPQSTPFPQSDNSETTHLLCTEKPNVW